MKPAGDRHNLNKIWREFLAHKRQDMKISRHCLAKIKARFPQLEEMPVKKFFIMVCNSKPCEAILDPKSKCRGLKVTNGKIIFVISLQSKKIMTLYPCPAKSPKKKGRISKIKIPYHRPAAKIAARKEIRAETSA